MIYVLCMHNNYRNDDCAENGHGTLIKGCGRQKFACIPFMHTGLPHFSDGPVVGERMKDWTVFTC